MEEAAGSEITETCEHNWEWVEAEEILNDFFDRLSGEELPQA